MYVGCNGYLFFIINCSPKESLKTKKNVLTHSGSFNQEFGNASESLMRFPSRCWPGLESSHGLTGAGWSTSKTVHLSAFPQEASVPYNMAAAFTQSKFSKEKDSSPDVFYGSALDGTFHQLHHSLLVTRVTPM